MAYRILVQLPNGLWRQYGGEHATKADAVNEAKHFGKSTKRRIERVHIVKGAKK